MKMNANEDAVKAHYGREIELFHLKPWEMPPVMAITPTQPGGKSVWDTTWPLARKRRLAFLKADPHHYDDCHSTET